MLAEQAHGVDEEVVEVHRPGLEQAGLVLARTRRRACGRRCAGPAAATSSGVEQLVLPPADQPVHAARREALGVEVQVADDVAGQPHRIGLVVDGELAGVAEAVGVGPQDAHARRVERAHPHRPGHRPDERGDAVAHLVGGLVGERDGEDLRRGHALVDQVGDAVGEHPRLARTGAGDDEQRPAAVHDGVELVGVEPVGGDRVRRACPGPAYGRGAAHRVPGARLAHQALGRPQTLGWSGRGRVSGRRRRGSGRGRGPRGWWSR